MYALSSYDERNPCPIPFQKNDDASSYPSRQSAPGVPSPNLFNPPPVVFLLRTIEDERYSDRLFNVRDIVL